jgi:hypothetical protein
MKVHLIEMTRAPGDPESTDVIQKIYNTLSAACKRLSLNKKEQQLVGQWFQGASIGHSLRVQNRRTKEEALLIATPGEAEMQETVLQEHLERITRLELVTR